MSEFRNWESLKLQLWLLQHLHFTKRDLMQMRPRSNEYLNMQKQQSGTDSHILTKWKRVQHYKMILFCTNDSPSILLTGVYFKYFQVFSTCIPCFLSIVLCLAGERLPASFWAVLVVLYSLPFPRLTNSVQSIFCQIPFSYEKKKKATDRGAPILQTTPSLPAWSKLS